MSKQRIIIGSVLFFLIAAVALGIFVGSGRTKSEHNRNASRRPQYDVAQITEKLSPWLDSFAKSQVPWEKALTGSELVFEQVLMSEDFRADAYALYSFVKDNKLKGYVLVDNATGELIEAGSGQCPVLRLSEKIEQKDKVAFYYPVYRPGRFELCVSLKDQDRWGYYDEGSDSVLPFDVPISSLEEGRAHASENKLN